MIMKPFAPKMGAKGFMIMGQAPVWAQPKKLRHGPAAGSPDSEEHNAVGLVDVDPVAARVAVAG
jgi:hypothetical protein